MNICYTSSRWKLKYGHYEVDAAHFQFARISLLMHQRNLNHEGVPPQIFLLKGSEFL